MSAARHLAWMLNPNLGEADVLRLVQHDCEGSERRMESLCLAAQRVGEKRGRRAALDVVAQNLWLVLL